MSMEVEERRGVCLLFVVGPIVGEGAGLRVTTRGVDVLAFDGLTGMFDSAPCDQNGRCLSG